MEQFTRERMAKVQDPERLERTQFTMKKFGLLPRDFNLVEFSVKANVQGVAGYLRRREENDFHAELGSD